MGKVFSLLALVIFVSSLACALEMNVDYSSKTFVNDIDCSVDVVLSIEDAEFGLYNVYTLGDMYILPDDVFVINGTDYSAKFTITPFDSLDKDGTYPFTYILNHRGVEKFDERVFFEFVDLDDAILVSSDVIDVTNGTVQFYVENLIDNDLENLTAHFSSILFDFDYNFDLAAGEKLYVAAPVDAEILQATESGVYIIEAVFETEGDDVELDGNLYLGENKGITSLDDKSGFLVRTHAITKVNSGNVVEEVLVTMEYNIFSRLFTTFNVEPYSVVRDGSKITYTFVKDRLAPTDAFFVRGKTNYLLPLLVLIFLVFAGLGLKRYLETKIDVKKSVKPVKTKNGEFALKVQLSVKARKNLKNVKISDRVPVMVKIYNKFSSLQPDKIDAKSRRIFWSIEELDAGEERIFNYIVYSKVGIVGKFVLPAARISFEDEEKKMETTSNKVFFMNEQSE